MSPSSIRCVLPLIGDMWGHLALFLSLTQTTIGEHCIISHFVRDKDKKKMKLYYRCQFENYILTVMSWFLIKIILILLEEFFVLKVRI